MEFQNYLNYQYHNMDKSQTTNEFYVPDPLMHMHLQCWHLHYPQQLLFYFYLHSIHPHDHKSNLKSQTHLQFLPEMGSLVLTDILEKQHMPALSLL